MNDAGNVIRVGRARRDGWFTGALPESAALTAVIWTDTHAVDQMKEQRQRGQERTILRQVREQHRMVLLGPQPVLQIGPPPVEELLGLGLESQEPARMCRVPRPIRSYVYALVPFQASQ